jgi:murein DD-endopeptidase MepM/ murein hydrolase activator NlpD
MQLKQITVSLGALYIGVFVIVTIVALAGYGIHDYMTASKNAARAVVLAEKVSSQQAKITRQQTHIQQFANDIKDLKSELVALNQFEKKIRVIADIQDSDQQKGFFGIGGFIPEDLEPRSAMVGGAALDRPFLRRMHARIDQLETAASQQETAFETLLQYLEKQKSILNCTPSICPAKGWISSSFGYRKNPFTGRREMHRGLDIANHKGTPIIAPAEGVVTYVGRKGLLGNIVEINHGHGFITRYGHISKALTQKGQKVKRGEEIAQIGTTGRSTGPHLHYEVRLNGIQVNPQKYILN